MKQLATVLLMMVSLIAKAERLSCTYISSRSELSGGFLTDVTAEFNCNGKIVQFIGSNIYVSCKPQFVLLKFTESLLPGELVEFNVANFRVSTIDGAFHYVDMVRNAFSESGKILEPQTIIQHGKPIKCDPTQIVANSL